MQRTSKFSDKRTFKKRSGRSIVDRLRRIVSKAGPIGKGRESTISAMAAIVVMMVFGGGIPAALSILLISLVGMILLARLISADWVSAMSNQSIIFAVGLIGIALLPLLQLVPLPPTLWHALPGQVMRVQTLALAGLADSWQPLSLTPLFTAGSAAIAITFVTLIALLLTLSIEDFRRVGWLILGIVGINILMGLIQVASGGQALQIYEASDHGALLGFYANKNHAALVLATSMPIAAYLLGSRSQTKGTRAWMSLYAGIVMVAIITTNSRAGFALGLVALLSLGLLYIRSIKPVYVIGSVAVIVAITVLISMSSAFEQVFSRFNAVDQDLRWQFLWTSRPLINQYWLFGSGIGSFSTLYTANEALAWVKPTYVNQLHDEYPQLLLETGIAGIAVLVALLTGCVWRGVAIWRGGNPLHRLPLICGGLILVLIAAHSFVDYPLRRPAVLPILALAIVMVIRGDLIASTGMTRGKQRL